MEYIDTDKFSDSLRQKSIRVESKEVLITNFKNSEQEKDLTQPANCNGFGRIRHFRFGDGRTWPANPLPIYPAMKALKLPFQETVRAQVFQNAVCNWRCWYCFVDFQLLSGNRKFSDYLTSKELIRLYLQQDERPSIIDLTGGQPDLTPEWTVWMMEELKGAGLENETYLWSDDNLSNDYLWRYLSRDQIDLMRSYKMYGRVCCFKGIDEQSFFHNTGAHPELFNRQFEIWEKLMKLGIDLYSYITLPALPTTNFKESVQNLMDRIQSVDENYLLRIVPLEIKIFTPSLSRVKDLHAPLLEGQAIAIDVWKDEMQKRYSSELLIKDITEIRTKFQYQ